MLETISGKIHIAAKPRGAKTTACGLRLSTKRDRWGHRQAIRAAVCHRACNRLEPCTSLPCMITCCECASNVEPGSYKWEVRPGSGVFATQIVTVKGEARNV